jgi:hypothetical protein
VLRLVLSLKLERVRFLQQRNALVRVERAREVSRFEALLERVEARHVAPRGHQV